MDDAVHLVQIGQALHHRHHNLAAYINVNRAVLRVDGIERASVHVLHTHVNVDVAQTRPVKADNVLRLTLVQDLQFTEDLLAHFGLGVDEHNLYE